MWLCHGWRRRTLRLGRHVINGCRASLLRLPLIGLRVCSTHDLHDRRNDRHRLRLQCSLPIAWRWRHLTRWRVLSWSLNTGKHLCLSCSLRRLTGHGILMDALDVKATATSGAFPTWSGRRQRCTTAAEHTRGSAATNGSCLEAMTPGFGSSMLPPVTSISYVHHRLSRDGCPVLGKRQNVG